MKSCHPSLDFQVRNPKSAIRNALARSLSCAVLVLLSTYCLLPIAFGQSATATLSGTVEDQNRAVVPGAKVKAINLGTGLERETLTNDSGDFTIPLLPPSTYTVRVERDGFATVEISNVVLNIGDQKALQIQLKAGTITEMVKIEGDALLINESPAVGTVVDRQFVENLPLNGRSFQALITLTPGVVLTKVTTFSRGQFSVNGQRSDANYFTVDGVSANIGASPTTGVVGFSGGSLPGLSASGGTNSLVSVDALQEFKIQTSTYAPEFGRTPGAQVQILTRSGTNRLSGAIFEYFRNDVLDANDWFANSRGLRKPALRQNDFGFVLSGPVLLPRFGEGGSQPWYNGRDRTFFFLSYEGLRLRLPQTQVTSVPSLSLRQAAAPQIQPFLNAFPVPNGRDFGNGFAEFAASYSDPSTLDATSIRVDHTVSPKLNLFGRYNHAPSDNMIRGVGFSLNSVGLTRYKAQTLTAGATFAISERIINEFRANWSKNRAGGDRVVDNFGGASSPPDSILFPPFASRQESQFAFAFGQAEQFVAGNISDNFQRQINLVDNLSIGSGSHQLKLGVDYRRLSPITSPAGFFFAYSANQASALLGRVRFVFIGANDGPFFPLFNNFSAFAQDTWKVSHRLTLTYGLRWELNPAPSEKNGRLAFTAVGLDDPATIGLAPPNTSYWKTTYNNFAPRVGFAYQLSDRQGKETLVRGGYGIFYDLGSADAAAGYGGYPFQTLTILFNRALPIDLASLQPPPFKSNPLEPPYDGPVLGFDPNLKLPYTHQWNFAVEHSLGSNQTLSASYVAALGRRLLRRDVLLSPNPNFLDSVFSIRNSADSDYHAFQLQFQRRISRGLQALASYTWSHSIDTGSDNFSFNAPDGLINLAQERAASDFDVRHAFSAALTYNIPKSDLGKILNAFLHNWSVDTIVTARSATPVNVVTGTDPLNIGLFGPTSVTRPDLVSSVPLYIDDPSVGGGKRFNRSAFVVPTTTRQGTLGRNALRGFPLSQVDVALRRQFNLSERVNFQFRAEFFNVFNHPNFADPVNFLTSPLFGQSTEMLGRSLGSGVGIGGLNPLYQVGGPRSIQFATRLTF